MSGNDEPVQMAAKEILDALGKADWDSPTRFSAERNASATRPRHGFIVFYFVELNKHGLSNKEYTHTQTLHVCIIILTPFMTYPCRYNGITTVIYSVP